MPKKLKLDVKELDVKSFKTKNEKIVGGYFTAHINTCAPCVGDTKVFQCTMGGCASWVGGPAC